jgi:hypothetical protein
MLPIPSQPCICNLEVFNNPIHHTNKIDRHFLREALALVREGSLVQILCNLVVSRVWGNAFAGGTARAEERYKSADIVRFLVREDCLKVRTGEILDLFSAGMFPMWFPLGCYCTMYYFPAPSLASILSGMIRKVFEGY